MTASFGPARCVRLSRLLLYFVWIVTSLTAAPASQADRELGLRVSTETAPAGGWAQIKVFATAPRLVRSGSIAMDFDPAVFGNIANVAVFSATGDALGYVKVKGQHLDAHFLSPSAGIGQLPNLPVLAVWIPLLAGAKAGASPAVTLDPSGSPWTDAQGGTYTVTAIAGAVTIAGDLSVASITPGGGTLPAGTVLQIAGTGFDSTTTVSMDGAAIESLRFINSQQMEGTLGGATELTGKHFHLANAKGQTLDYFSAFPSAPSTPPAGFTGPSGIFPLTPLNAFSSVTTDYNLLLHPAFKRSLAMQNQSPIPVTVLRASQNSGGGGVGAVVPDSFTIPPGALYFLYTGEGVQITATAAIRMVELIEVNLPDPTTSYVNMFTPAVALTPPAPLLIPLSPYDVSWSWQVGTPPPAAAAIDLKGNLGFTVTVSPSPWLSVTPVQGTAPATLVLKPNLAQLAPGVYTATVSVIPAVPASFPAYPAKATDITVSLTVSAGPLISASASNIFLFQGSPGGTPTGQNTLTLASNGQPAPFTVVASTTSGGQWLSVTPSSGTTPATVTFTANSAGLKGDSYSGDLAIQGPANTLHVAVRLTILPFVPPPGASLYVSLKELSFYLPAGAEAPQSGGQLISVGPPGVTIQVAAPTTTWLTAAVASNAPYLANVLVNASAANLAPGTYHDTILISSTTLGSIQVTVTLNVLNGGTAPTVTPSALTLTAAAGQSVSSDLTVTSGGDPVLFGAGFSTVGNQGWLSGFGPTGLPPLFEATTPGTIHVTASTAQTGTYQGEVLIFWAKGTIHVPVTFTATPSSIASPPMTTAILNAASQTPGQMAPGEIFTIFGLGIGPAPVGLQFDASGKVATTLNGVKVTVNDVAAPLVYASPGQLNAIIPYETGTNGVARIRVIYGQGSGAWDVPLAGAAPAVFTIGSTGVGQGAVLNQDSSVNGEGNAAVRGSVIQIFATGEGQTGPAGRTGTVTGAIGGAPVLPVKVTVGGIDAVVQFAGSAPHAVAGLFQVNAVVPEGATPGSAVPLLLSVGGVVSQSGVTIAVQ